MRNMDATIRTVTKADRDEWFKMCKGICPEAPDEYLLSDMDVILASEENEESIRVHLKLGYSEVERLVHFVKRI